jgi:uncharacterized protein involved in oxidation of intracellular sulfur
MKILMIINDPPYGSEKTYNALRLVMAIQKLKESQDAEITVFLMGDAVVCALPEQSTPEGFYNIERMLKSIIKKGGRVKTCMTCLSVRGMLEIKLMDGAELGTIDQLAELTLNADKIVSL